MTLDEIIKTIEHPEKSLEPEARNKIDFKTKPQGSLGALEYIAVRMSLIQESLNPRVNRKVIITYAGDHGIAAEGVSAYPAEVTPQMVLNFLNGGAAINVLCRQNGIDLRIVDMGVNYDFESHPELVDRKIRKGTRNFLREEAMTRDEAILSLQNGIDLFYSLHEKDHIDIIGLGDMGIGNTTSSSAIISAVTGASPNSTTGRGTGIDDDALKQKIKAIETALKFHKADKNDAVDILQKVGGFEIGGITGTILAAACCKIPVLMDGIISTAGGLLAYTMCPRIAGYLFSAHRSAESGQKIALDHMGLSPILDLNMRLGEGTGAALAMNIIDASCRIMSEMASFDEAGISGQE